MIYGLELYNSKLEMGRFDNLLLRDYGRVRVFCFEIYEILCAAICPSQ